MADSKSRQSGSKEEVVVKERRRARDFGSAKGKRIFWMESRHSRAICRGMAPLYGNNLRQQLLDGDDETQNTQ